MATDFLLAWCVELHLLAQAPTGALEEGSERGGISTASAQHLLGLIYQHRSMWTCTNYIAGAGLS